jgi:DNA mismatch repair protein MutS
MSRGGAAQPAAGDAAATPAMAQYQAAKRQHPDALLFFRMGDFYELFWDDAREASRALGITLTSRNKGPDAIPMAGVPFRAVDGYLKRLVERGYRVAICEQMQDPREAKGVVERQVVRVVTPGTLTEDGLLDGRRPNHLAAVVATREQAGVAWVELSTGAFRVLECARDQLAEELQRIEPAELLHAEGEAALAAELQQAGGAALTRRAGYEFGLDTARDRLQRFFAVGTLDGFDLGDAPLATGAAGALIGYLQETQLAALPHIVRIERQHRRDRMVLDRATRQSLELTGTMRGETGATSLLAVLDRSRTPMGARLLRDWVLAPLLELDAIHARQDAIEELLAAPGALDGLHDGLGSVLDLERLTARISTGRCNARDLLGLAQSLARIPALLGRLDGMRSERLLAARAADPLADLAGRLLATLADDPPLTVRDGGMIRAGADAELDELHAIGRDSREWIARYQAREIERTGIANLRVGFNKVFGFYLEVTHGNRDVALPPEYLRRQTTKHAERYVTRELEEFESKVLRSEELARDREYALFGALRETAAAATPRLLATAAAIAELDVLVGLAVAARELHWHRPRLDDSRVLKIGEGRHPVLEATHAAGTFVPNDTDLDPPARRLALLTGPNMAGKSTYIRQVALLVLLAQIGSYVPAREARIGLVDRIFTRVGAADDISRGASTFMVEMVETANILHHATPKSLVILDEVGRGTSTYDGLALAWAIAEDLRDRIGCRALFATHYHQMTDLAEAGPGVLNLRVAVREWGDEIVFLHRIEPGGTDRSYGLHVGRLAGLPKAVLARARDLLARLEQDAGAARAALATPSAPTGRRQLPLFTSPEAAVLAELAGVDVEQMTPIDALQRLAELARKARELGGGKGR